MASLLSGLAGKLPGIPTSVSSLASTVTGVPTATSATSSGQSIVQKFLNMGIPVGWFGLLILAGGVPIAPLSFLGYAGANLMVTGSLAWAAAKMTVQLGTALAVKMISAYYPAFWIYSWILTYSPWYIFDIVQLFSPTFAVDGFKIPFAGTQIGNKGGVGKVTLPVLAALIAITAMGGYSLMDYIPREITGSLQPILKTLFAVIGGGVALAGGGIGAFTMLPGLLKSVSGSVSEIGAVAPVVAAVAAPSVAPVPVPVPSVAPAPVVAPVPFVAPKAQSGPSAPIQKGGAQPFDLDAIAREFTGGGRKDADASGFESYAFMGILSIAVLGGTSLAFLRSQQAS